MIIRHPGVPDANTITGRQPGGLGNRQPGGDGDTGGWLVDVWEPGGPGVWGYGGSGVLGSGGLEGWGSWGLGVWRAGGLGLTGEPVLVGVPC